MPPCVVMAVIRSRCVVAVAVIRRIAIAVIGRIPVAVIGPIAVVVSAPEPEVMVACMGPLCRGPGSYTLNHSGYAVPRSHCACELTRAYFAKNKNS
jgi:hypothetical protein